MGRRGITALDNPFNGYVDGYCESENLGIFTLTPKSMQFNNFAPNPDPIWYIMETENEFYTDRLDFDADTL